VLFLRGEPWLWLWLCLNSREPLTCANGCALRNILYPHSDSSRLLCPHVAILKTFRAVSRLSQAYKSTLSPITHSVRPSYHTAIRATHFTQVRMASTGLEDSLKDLSLVKESYPQAKDAGSDPVKLSSAIFPSAEVGEPATLFTTE